MTTVQYDGTGEFPAVDARQRPGGGTGARPCREDRDPMTPDRCGAPSLAGPACPARAESR
jgi:hypothetical protein